MIIKEVSVDYKKILVAVDFTDTARKAFYVALKYAAKFDAFTYVLHVFQALEKKDRDSDVEKLSSEIERLEDGVKRRINELFVKGGLREVDRKKVKVEIQGGDVADAVIKFAVANQVDLIVMGHNPAGVKGIKGIFKKGPALKVVDKAPCDVLVIKPHDYDYDPDVPEKFRKV